MPGQNSEHKIVITQKSIL